MLFNSWGFIALLLLTLTLYYLPIFGKGRASYQVGLLLIASGFFYAWNNPELLPLLVFSCTVNAVSATKILHLRLVGSDTAARRWMRGAVIINLALLAFYKYLAWLLGIFPESWVSESLLEWARAIPLPVGISFYTFQGISLVVDVWRRELENEGQALDSMRKGRKFGSWRDLSFYIAFFPQLVAGPIVKARDFVGQIGAKCAKDILWVDAIRLLILGYFLKMYVADNLAEHTGVLNTSMLKILDGVSSLSLLYAYGFQIFADFAGYSLIAIGLGALFGYRLPENFRFPYLSLSITEFWRRWHLSLSSWLREYLYIPLGGNRKGPGRTYVNLFLVMFLGGLWHGAEWKFALWGTSHGLLLALERLLSRSSSLPTGIRKKDSVWLMSIKWIFCFNAVMFLWLTFLMEDMGQIAQFMDCLIHPSGLFIPRYPFILIVFGTPVVIYHLYGWIMERQFRWTGKLKGSLLDGLACAVMLFLIVTNHGTSKGFIYFQF